MEKLPVARSGANCHYLIKFLLISSDVMMVIDFILNLSFTFQLEVSKRSQLECDPHLSYL